jgi:hypothetical protein
MIVTQFTDAFDADVRRRRPGAGLDATGSAPAIRCPRWPAAR